MSWLRRVLGMCDHKWKIIEQRGLTDGGVRVGMRYILQCEHCGDVKKKDCD